MPWKNAMLLSFGLLMLLASHLHVYYEVNVNGKTLDGLYSRDALKQCTSIAEDTAEELLPGEAAAPPFQKRGRLSLRLPDGDRSALTNAMILAYPDVVLSDGVVVNGVQLGTVEDGRELYARLRSFIENQMPNQAVFGNISGQLEIRPVYSRTGHETDYDDMILLISGMAPVLYTDNSGKLV